MAHFRGTIQGARGMASRLGHKSSGLTIEAASWSGKIVTELRHNAKTGEDEYTIYQTTHHGHGISRPIASGVIGLDAMAFDKGQG
jgi:hypothetical protein